MLKTFLNVNVALSNRFTPHALFEARAFQLYDWIGQALILDPAVQTVLDIGAGRTWHFGALKSKRSFRLIGLDDDADELAANPLLDDIIVADASSRLDIPERSVDLILSRATVEHLPNNQTFIENCYRCVRPGGRVLLVFANRWSPPAILNRLLPRQVTQHLLLRLVPNSKGYQGFKAPYDECSHSRFKSMLQNSGFEVEYEYNSYYSSSYFQFFFPLHTLSIFLDYIRSALSIRDLSSQCLFVARRPDH